MKILQVNDSLRILGGAEQYLIDSSAALEKRGHKVFLSQEKDDLASLVKKEKIDVAILHNVFKIDIYKRLPNLLPTVRYVHDHRTYSPGSSRMHFASNEICLSPLNLGHYLLYAYTQRCMSRNPWKIFSLVFQRRTLLKLHNGLAKVMANSEFVKDLLFLNGINEELLEVIHPSINKPKVSKNLQVEKPVVLFAGRLFIEKGVEYLLAAMVNINKAEAWIVGSGWDEERLKKMTVELKLTDRVKFFGFVEPKELGKFYQAATVGVVPSIWPEPFGLSGIAFYSFGKPVVAFDVGGVKEWLDDGETGFLVRRLDVGGLTKAINTLLYDRQKRGRLGQNAQKSFEENFSMDKHLDKLEKILAEVVSKKHENRH